MLKSLNITLIIFCSVIALSTSVAETETRQVERICESGLPYDYLPRGSSYQDVLQKIGKPKHKVEQETKRKDVWVYNKGAIEFVSGKLKVVRCKDPQPKLTLKNPKSELRTTKNNKPQLIAAETSPEDLKNITAAITALNASSIDTETAASTTPATASRTTPGGVTFPVGKVPPSFGGRVMPAEPFDLVE